MFGLVWTENLGVFASGTICCLRRNSRDLRGYDLCICNPANIMISILVYTYVYIYICNYIYTHTIAVTHNYSYNYVCLRDVHLILSVWQKSIVAPIIHLYSPQLHWGNPKTNQPVILPSPLLQWFPSHLQVLSFDQQECLGATRCQGRRYSDSQISGQKLKTQKT